MHDGFGHHFADRPPHQFVVMGHHLTYGEGKGPKEIEFRNNPQHLSFFYDGKELKSCFSNNASSSRMVVWRVTVVTARVIY
jgi:hypothetical protein